MESDRISMIKDWPTPESVWDVPVLLAFTNFYRQFIRKLAKVTTPISDLLKKAENSRTSQQVK
jgi:DNA/RNA-binding domain of Phe-tRNA-synthetase-like protein